MISPSFFLSCENAIAVMAVSQAFKRTKYYHDTPVRANVEFHATCRRGPTIQGGTDCPLGLPALSCSPDAAQRNPGRTERRTPGLHCVSSRLRFFDERHEDFHLVGLRRSILRLIHELKTLECGAHVVIISNWLNIHP